MDSRGQGSLEYLLILGGAVLIAVVVISFLISQTQVGIQVGNQEVNTFRNILPRR